MRYGHGPAALFKSLRSGGAGPADLLTTPALGPDSKMPESKVCAVRLDRVAPAVTGPDPHMNGETA